MSALIATTYISIWLRQFVRWPTLATVAFPMLMLALFSYSPAVASVIARISLREGFKDISLRLRGEWVVPAMLIAWFWPVFCGFATYGVAWMAGFTRFAWTSSNSQFGSWGPENLVGFSIAGMPPPRAFAIRLVACLFFAIVACLQSFGEELGWRGYLLARLFHARIPVPVFWNGLIWGLWHIPFYLADKSPRRNLPESPAVSLFFFVASTVALAYLVSYLRLRSGSIWPAVLAHASCNVIFTLGFDSFTVANEFWIGELYLLSVGLPVLFLLLSRRRWIVRQWPQRGSEDTGDAASPASLSYLA